MAIRPAVFYGLKCLKDKKGPQMRDEHGRDRMMRHMCDKTKKDMLRSEYIKGRVRVAQAYAKEI